MENIKLNKDDISYNIWVHTDDAQWIKMVNTCAGDCVEVRLFTNDTYCVVSGRIDLYDYEDEDIQSCLETYGYKGVDDVKSQYPTKWTQIVVECMFEMTDTADLNYVSEFATIEEAIAEAENMIGGKDK